MTTLDNQRNLIFGAGPLGLAIMDELLARGRQVTLVNRGGRVSEPLPAGVSLKQADATDPAAVAAVVHAAAAAVVFHAAQPAYTEWPTKFPPITQGILDGVAQTDARLVFGDNLYMYGSTGGAPIHEDLPYAASGHKGRVRAAMANSLLAAHQAGRVQVAIGRASDFYGPRVEGSAVGDLVFDAVLAGKTVNVMGDIDLPHTYTYIKDFAWGLVTLSEQEGAYGRAWHVPSAPALSTRQFVEKVGEMANRPVKIRAAGRLMVYLIGLFVPILREYREMMYEFEEAYVVDHSQFEAAFGSRITPHTEAMADTLAWYAARRNTSAPARQQPQQTGTVRASTQPDTSPKAR